MIMKYPLYPLVPLCLFKEKVYPEIKIQSSFTHLKFSQTCMTYFLLLNTKEDIFKDVRNQTVDGPH